MTKNKDQWLSVISKSYEEERLERESYDDSLSKLEFLASCVFGINTYDPDEDCFFAKMAIRVCEAITRGETYKLIEDPDSYRWYLVMCHLPFFAEKIEWGTSIRGAWWSHAGIRFVPPISLADGGELIDGPLCFERDEWVNFVEAVIEFGGCAA